MEIFRQHKLLCIFMLLLSMDLTKANIPIQRRMVGEYVTFPWMNPSEDNFGNAIFAPDEKSIIRIGQDSKPEYEYPLLYEERASLVPEGVLLQDLCKSDEGLYKSEDRNNPPMDNTRLFVYTERELWPLILVDNTLFTSDSPYTVLQEDLKIIAQQDLQANITLTFNEGKWNRTLCTNAPICVYHVKTSPDPDFNTNISVSVTVDYGFYHLQKNFTVYVNGTTDDIAKGWEICWFICGPICLILLVLLVWSNRKTMKSLVVRVKTVCGRVRRRRRISEQMQLNMVGNGANPNIPQIVIETDRWTSYLQTMIPEAERAKTDEKKLAELRENFRDPFLKDLAGDDTLGNDNWCRFDCFHSKQIWELINLLTESGRSNNPIVLNSCIGFAQFCLETWNDEDNYDMVEIVLFVLFNLTKWNSKQHKISREYLETIASFLHSEKQRVSFLCCRYLVLIFCTGIYKNIGNWKNWKADVQKQMFHTINNWKLAEQCIQKTRNRYLDIQYFLNRQDEPVIQFFAVWLVQKFLYEKVDITLLKNDIGEDPFERVSDRRTKTLVDEVKNDYHNALWNLQVGEWG